MSKKFWRSSALFGKQLATLLQCPARKFSLQQVRNTVILKHVFQPERTPDGEHQRRPEEHPNFQKYELVEIEELKPLGRIKVILLEEIEEVGLKFDVVEVSKHFARHNLIPLQKAVYATDFDLKYYAEKMEGIRIERENKAFSSITLLNSDRLYTKKHGWISVKETVGTVGISSFAQETLGHVVYIKLPEVGLKLLCGETAGAIIGVKAASDVYSPVSGVVIEKNTEVEEKPHLINKSTDEKGWLYKLELTDAGELKNLMDEEAYEKVSARARKYAGERQ